MTFSGFRRHRSGDGRQPAFSGDFPPADRDITETIRAVQPEWDGRTYEFSGASDAGLPGGAYDVWGADFGQVGGRATRQPEQGTGPLARLRAVPPAPDTFPALPDPPAPHAQYDPRDTAPQQRLPRMNRVRERARPQRPADAAIIIWSALLGQHIMKCGVCLRSRYADPIAGHMPFAFESLRVSAHVSGWRLDAFDRWACPACQMTAAYHSPRPVIHSHPEIRRRKLAGDDVSRSAEAAAIAIAEHDLIRDVAESAGHGRHRVRVP